VDEKAESISDDSVDFDDDYDPAAEADALGQGV